MNKLEWLISNVVLSSFYSHDNCDSGNRESERSDFVKVMNSKLTSEFDLNFKSIDDVRF